MKIYCLVAASLFTLPIVCDGAEKPTAGGVQAITVAPSEYPDSEMRAGHEGTAYVDVRVTSDGYVTAVNVARSSGWPVLDKAAQETVKKLRFGPVLATNGASAETVENIPIRFKASNPSNANDPATKGAEFDRLGRIWSNYTGYKYSTQKTLQTCEKMGVPIGNAIELNEKFNVDALKSQELLVERLRRIYTRAGITDSQSYFQNMELRVHEFVDKSVSDMFAGLNASQSKEKCASLVRLAKTSEGGYRYRPGYFEHMNWEWIAAGR